MAENITTFINNIIYKTTNIINNKFYIGIHSTNKIEDDYLGSGKLLKKAIKKYGVNNFKREILFNYKNRILADKKEKEIVNKEFIKNNLTYNLALGGRSGPGLSNKGYKHTKEAIKKISESSKRPCSYAKKIKIGNANRNNKMSKDVIENNSKLRIEYYKNNDSPMKNKKHLFCSNYKNRIKHLGKKVLNKKGKLVLDINTNKTYISLSKAIIDLNIPKSFAYKNINKVNFNLKYI